MKTSPPLTVFELANKTTRELYLGFTPLSFREFMTKTRKKPPKVIRHWDFRNRIAYRSLEFGLSRKEAQDFLAAHLGKHKVSPWHLILAADAGMMVRRYRQLVRSERHHPILSTGSWRMAHGPGEWKVLFSRRSGAPRRR